jgi:tetratricopeptide (TPR) repeat protein
MRQALHALVLACWLLGSAARADEREAEYQELIHGAITEMDRGDPMEALGLFRRAHELRPSARTLRGIGVALYELRDYVGALRALSLALEDTRTPLGEDLRIEASTLVSRARTFVARVRLALEPPQAQVRVDGLEPVREGPLLLLNPGAHTLEAAAPGHVSITRQLSVQAGQQDELVLTLAPAPLPAVSARAPARRVPPQPPVRAEPESERWTERPVAAWFYLGAGAFAAGAAETAVWWVHLQRDLERCDRSCLVRDDLRDRRTIAQGLTYGFGALAAASLTMGVLWQRRIGPALACSPLESGLACRGQVRY